MAVAALVGQPRHAVRQIEVGVDLLIAQGTEAGGHTGTIATMVLTPEIVDIAAGRPVLAAGGIASGRQMAAALALGAAGVWCGSVWLSSQEDVANQAIKDKFLQATSSDTVRSPTRTGKPARQLRSAWHEEWERPGSPAPLPMPLQPMLVNDAWQRIDAAAQAGHEGALRLESSRPFSARMPSRISALSAGGSRWPSCDSAHSSRPGSCRAGSSSLLVPGTALVGRP